MITIIDYKKIDKGFRPIIKLLNEKGYVTTVCCEGHLDKLPKPKTQRIDIYLGFKYDYEFPIPIPLHNDVFYNYRPKSKRDKPYSLQIADKIFYWFTPISCSVEDKEKMRQSTMNKLLEWATALPIREKERIYHYEILGYGKKGGEYYLGYSYDKQKAIEELRDKIKKSPNRYKEIVVKEELVKEF